MSEKLLAILTPVSEFLQKGTATISSTIGTFDPFWIVVAIAAVLLAFAIVFLEKPKIITWVLIIFVILYPFLHYSRTRNRILRTEDAKEYGLMVLGALPLIALLVHKYKKRKH